MSRSFNGTSDVITVAGTSTLSPTAVTLSFWVNPISINGNAYQLVCGDCDSSVSNYQVLIKSAGTVAWYTSAGSVHLDPGSHTLSAGTWYNLVLTYDSTNGLKTFVNNSSDGTVAPAGNLGTTSRTFLMGNQTGLTRFANINLADVAVWNLSLSATEITALFNGARPYTIRPSALLGYWPLDGLQSPEPDLSGNVNNGSLSGTAIGFGPPFMALTPRWPRFQAPPATSSFQAAWAMRNRIVVEGIGI